jgi:hypothetical protein
MAQEKHLKADVAILGGGTGGVAAALGALAMGRTVVMTEPTLWVGGQLTQQAVPPDENPAIEYYGGTLRYRTYRRRVREFYLQHYPVAERIRRHERESYPSLNPNKWHTSVEFNPGGGNVSVLCHEFKVGLAVLEAWLMPHEAAGRLRLLRRNEPVAAEVDADTLKAVRVRHLDTGEETAIEAAYFLDATELGDLLALSGTEYVEGFESREMTGEPTAPEHYQPLNQQAISWTYVLERTKPSEANIIEQPEQYAFWRDYVPEVDPPWPGKLLDFTDVEPMTLKTRTPNLQYGRWNFRRICNPDNFADGGTRADLTLVNWPHIDYFLGPLTGVSGEDKKKHMKGAEQLSLSWLYWLQTEAPRSREDGGGQGYPELKLRPDITGDTPNGLAMYPYIRESRRIQAEFTVFEQHVAKKLRGDQGAEFFEDSVGIGHYNIDLHPSTGGNNYIDVPCCPHQIPLGALIPKRMENLLPACKNLGVTHLTNGAYRLHPIEWNVGEAAGILAAHCAEHHLMPRQVRNDAKRLEEFQALIRDHGIPTRWPRVVSDRPEMW